MQRRFDVVGACLASLGTLSAAMPPAVLGTDEVRKLGETRGGWRRRGNLGKEGREEGGREGDSVREMELE